MALTYTKLESDSQVSESSVLEGICSSMPEPDQSAGSQQPHTSTTERHTQRNYKIRCFCTSALLLALALWHLSVGEICLSELNHSQGDILLFKMVYVFIQ